MMIVVSADISLVVSRASFVSIKKKKKIGDVSVMIETCDSLECATIVVYEREILHYMIPRAASPILNPTPR